MSEQYYWHCLQCGAHDPVEPTGDEVEYTLGDHEPCIECGSGTAHVVTLRMGAAYEQGRALGMSAADAWARARDGGERGAVPCRHGAVSCAHCHDGKPK